MGIVANAPNPQPRRWEKIIQIEIGIAIEIESRERKVELDRMAAMLSRLGKRGYTVEEALSSYGFDPDFDSDFDSDGTKSQPGAALNADKPRE